jgi:hypothetical protein
MNTVILIASIYGLVFLIKETDGPWGTISWFRNKLMNNKFVGVFFYKLLSCYFCSGCHAGWMVYLLSASYHEWSVNNFVLWILAGGAISFILNLIVEKLSNQSEI